MNYSRKWELMMYRHPGNRPRFLSLTAFKFPLNAKLSALHRITGLILIISLLGYLALAQLIIFHPIVTMDSIHDHCFINCLNSVFWSAISFHWLSGIRHLFAEHFIQPHSYRLINSAKISYLLLSIWGLLTVFISYQAWS
ncbi:hypothetical protein THMIRHAM_10570 [Thiomicrorhabdus immobilis]|uniref:Succinate dehydrogenase cytochrome b556 subunit n=1 Tax=Thiomicrorhabdus immobilis TaxID=2791037 RepID=A0ABN6CZD9_9GAMM|nr:hypothetical protein [Thiomicrorhabdus immobilis]BCN93272.1 hypothetical protein THMIRHAM_10570 [Thiomicrorhabdus immobilis]